MNVVAAAALSRSLVCMWAAAVAGTHMCERETHDFLAVKRIDSF